MLKLTFLICLLFGTMAFCTSSDDQEANGQETLLEEPTYENTSERFNNTNIQGLPQEGQASFYANRFQGRLTANGEIYDTASYTAAHLTLPFGTKLKVTNLRNDKSVVVTVNDRGPHHKNRIIDLSQAAARKLGFINRGITKVRIEEAE